MKPRDSTCKPLPSAILAIRQSHLSTHHVHQQPLFQQKQNQRRLHREKSRQEQVAQKRLQQEELQQSKGRPHEKVSHQERLHQETKQHEMPEKERAQLFRQQHRQLSFRGGDPSSAVTSVCTLRSPGLSSSMPNLLKSSEDRALPSTAQQQALRRDPPWQQQRAHNLPAMPPDGMSQRCQSDGACRERFLPDRRAAEFSLPRSLDSARYQNRAALETLAPLPCFPGHAMSSSPRHLFLRAQHDLPSPAFDMDIEL